MNKRNLIPLNGSVPAEAGGILRTKPGDNHHDKDKIHSNIIKRVEHE